MSLSGQIFNFAVGLISSTGYVGIFVLMAAEGATLPVPSEVVLPFAGYLVFQGQLDFWVIVIVATIGAIVGALIDYSIGYYLGRMAILRYGRYIRLNENHLKTSERWFVKHGDITVLLAKFVPLIRTLISFPAGISEMKMWRFVLFSGAGSVAWNAILVYVGVIAGKNSQKIISALSNAFSLIEIVVIVVLILTLYQLLRRKAVKEKMQQS